MLTLLHVGSHHTTRGVPKNTIGSVLIKGKGRKQPPSLSSIEPGAYERARHLLKCKANQLIGYLKNKKQETLHPA